MDEFFKFLWRLIAIVFALSIAWFIFKWSGFIMLALIALLL